MLLLVVFMCCTLYMPFEVEMDIHFRLHMPMMLVVMSC